MLNLEINNETGKHTIAASGSVMEVCSDFVYAVFRLCYQLAESGKAGEGVSEEIRDCIAAAIQSDELFEKFRTDKADGITIIKMTEEV